MARRLAIDPEPNPWLSAGAFAAREGCDRTTVWRWYKLGLVERRALGPRRGVRFRFAPDGTAAGWPQDETGQHVPPMMLHRVASRIRLRPRSA